HFLCHEAEWSDGRLRTPAPVALLRVRRRWLKRRPVTGDVMAWHALTGTARLLDLSYAGLALRCRNPPDARTRLAGLAVSDGLRTVEVDAEVRWTDARGGRCGLAVTRADARWTALVSRQLHPRTATASAHNARVWDLFERSGYFDLFGKSPAD